MARGAGCRALEMGGFPEPAAPRLEPRLAPSASPSNRRRGRSATVCRKPKVASAGCCGDRSCARWIKSPAASPSGKAGGLRLLARRVPQRPSAGVRIRRPARARPAAPRLSAVAPRRPRLPRPQRSGRLPRGRPAPGWAARGEQSPDSGRVVVAVGRGRGRGHSSPGRSGPCSARTLRTRLARMTPGQKLEEGAGRAASCPPPAAPPVQAGPRAPDPSRLDSAAGGKGEARPCSPPAQPG